MIYDNKYVVEIYAIDVVNTKFVLLDSVTTFVKLSYVDRLSQAGACTFELAVQDPKASSLNLRRFVNQVVVKRNNVIKFFGPIIKIQGSYENVTGSIKVQCSGYLTHLATRQTAKIVNYVGSEQTAIAWDLINTTQNKANGDLLIRRGNTITTVNRDRTYEYSFIDQSLINLTRIDGGFDFDLSAVVDSDNDLSYVNFNVYSPIKGSYRTDLPSLRIGENIKSVQFRTDGDLVNAGIAEGEGTGTPIIATIDSTDSPYDSLQKAYTRREYYRKESDVSIQTTLQSHLSAYMLRNSAESILTDLTLYQGINPNLTDLNIGDILNLDLSLGNYLNVQTQGRITEISVDVDSQGAEVVTPRFSYIS